MKLIHMMDTKLEKSKKKNLTLKDFKRYDDVFIFTEGNHQIMFFDGYVRKTKRFIQVWYMERDMKYLKDEAIMDWEVLRYRPEIDERNRRFWDRINKFYEDYFDGNNDSSRV